MKRSWTIKRLAQRAGVVIVPTESSWGGRWGYKDSDYPTTTVCGFKTQAEAYRHWAEDCFGKHAFEALSEMLEDFK